MITDEMVEKAARAHLRAMFVDYDHLSEEGLAPVREAVRAALTAVLPDVVETFGDVREIRSTAWEEGRLAGLEEAAVLATPFARQIRERISQLLPQEGGK